MAERLTLEFFWHLDNLFFVLKILNQCHNLNVISVKDGIFVQIGLVPNSQFLENVIDLNPHGEIIVNENGETSEKGIFACGDVTTVPYKQIIISMGEGAKTALSVADYLMKTEDYDIELDAAKSA